LRTKGHGASSNGGNIGSITGNDGGGFGVSVSGSSNDGGDGRGSGSGYVKPQVEIGIM
jgi:hypothetical protein